MFKILILIFSISIINININIKQNLKWFDGYIYIVNTVTVPTNPRSAAQCRRQAAVLVVADVYHLELIGVLLERAVGRERTAASRRPIVQHHDPGQQVGRPVEKHVIGTRVESPSPGHVDVQRQVDGAERIYEAWAREDDRDVVCCCPTVSEPKSGPAAEPTVGVVRDGLVLGLLGRLDRKWETIVGAGEVFAIHAERDHGPPLLWEAERQSRRAREHHDERGLDERWGQTWANNSIAWAKMATENDIYI